MTSWRKKVASDFVLKFFQLSSSSKNTPNRQAVKLKISGIPNDNAIMSEEYWFWLARILREIIFYKIGSRRTSSHRRQTRNTAIRIKPVNWTWSKSIKWFVKKIIQKIRKTDVNWRKFLLRRWWMELGSRFHVIFWKVSCKCKEQINDDNLFADWAKQHLTIFSWNLKV